MTAKEYLKRLYNLDVRMKARYAQIATLKDRAAKATGAATALRTSGTPAHSKLEEAVCAYAGLQDELEADIHRFIQLRHEIRDVIDKVDNPDHKVLLEYRYLCFMSWEKIAVSMNYSWQWVHKLHGRALQSIDKQAIEGECQPVL